LVESVKRRFLCGSEDGGRVASQPGAALFSRQMVNGFSVPRDLVRRGGQANVIIDNEMFLSLKWDSDEQGSNRVRGG
jgi:hypothetical protein